MKKSFIFILLFALGIFMISCGTTMTHQIGYPSADDLFVTLGDDPGSESQKSYIPKGQLIHISEESYLLFPLLGIFVKFGNAEPQYVFDTQVIPKVKNMGGDALIGANVQYTPAGSWINGLIGLRSGARTVIVGQVVKR